MNFSHGRKKMKLIAKLQKDISQGITMKASWTLYLRKTLTNYLRKNKILIKGNIEVDKRFVTESGFAHKLFSMMTVSVNSQIVTKNNNKYLLCTLFVDIHFFFQCRIFSW